MKLALPFVLLFFLGSCYSIPELPGFETQKWKEELVDCSQNREQMAELIVQNEALLLGEGQAEIKALLGKPAEHELYNRNQKFFYYDLSKSGCPGAQRRLSIRFDALDRVKEATIIVTQSVNNQ